MTRARLTDTQLDVLRLIAEGRALGDYVPRYRPGARRGRGAFPVTIAARAAAQLASMGLVAPSAPGYVLTQAGRDKLTPTFTLIEVVRARCAIDPSWSRERKHLCEERLMDPDYGLTRYPLWHVVPLPVSAVYHDPAVDNDQETAAYVHRRRSGSPFPPILALPSREHPGTWWAHDGNHRVAAAKIVGDRFIDAYVPTEESAPPQTMREDDRPSNLHLALALDDIHEDLAFWIYYNDPAAKRALIHHYEALPARQRAALERAVEAVFAGRTLVAYRRLKPGDDLDRMGGMSLSTDRPTHAAFEVFELAPEDVLIHWAVTYPNGSPTPLGSRAYGHEHEVILRPDARPKHVGSGRAELREHADDSAFGDIARRRVYEPLRGERIVHAETVAIQMAPALVEDWALCVTEGKDAGSGYLDAGRILIDIQPQLDGEPLAGLVWFKEYGKKKITHVWIDPDVQRRGVGHALIDAYVRHVSRKVIMVGPFSEAGLSFAKRIGARIEQ